MAKKDKKKITIPKTVKELGMSKKKFAKARNIRISGKGLSKREKKRNKKRLNDEFSKTAVVGLNKAVKIITDNPRLDSKKVNKVKSIVEKLIQDPKLMKRVAKLYKKNPDDYSNMLFLPDMIVNTIEYYSQEGISDDDKEVGQNLDKESLLEFCEKILKGPIKRYRKLGVEDSESAFFMATVIPTNTLLKNNERRYYKLIRALYNIAGSREVNLDVILPAICKLDKKKSIDKKTFHEGFYSEFIFQKTSNRNHSFTDHQKDLHETLIERSLEFLDGQKSRKIKDILKTYIKRRKNAESRKNDSKRVIKFIDHANSNSPYTNLKAVIQELISDNSSNELYLS